MLALLAQVAAPLRAVEHPLGPRGPHPLRLKGLEVRSCPQGREQDHPIDQEGQEGRSSQVQEGRPLISRGQEGHP